MSLIRHLVLQELSLSAAAEWLPSNRCWTFFYVEAGHLYWIAEVKRIALESGAVLILSPAARGSLRVSQVASAKLRYFTFCPEMLFGFFTLREKEALKKLSPNVEFASRVLLKDSPMAERFRALSLAPQGPENPIQRCRMIEFVWESFAAALDVGAADNLSGYSSSRFDQLMSSVVDGELLELTDEELARYCNCGKRHLKKIFHRVCGISLTKKRITFRLLKAKELLRDSLADVDVVARDSGYRRTRAFVAAFRKEFGLTPGEWRLRSWSAPQKCESSTARAATDSGNGAFSQDCHSSATAAS